MIATIKLKVGREPDAGPASIRPGAVTVFVGPNGSGKTTLLSELNHLCLKGEAANTRTGPLLLDSVEFHEPSAGEADARFQHVVVNPQPPTIARQVVQVGRPGVGYTVVEPDVLREAIRKPNEHAKVFGEHYVRFVTRRLYTQDRTTAHLHTIGDLRQPPAGFLHALWRDNERRARLRSVVREALGLEVVLDPTELGKLRLAFAARPPSSEIEEVGLHEAAIQFHASNVSFGSARRMPRSLLRKP